MSYLDKNPLLFAGLRQVLRRGTAEILEESQQGLFLMDRSSGMYMLAADLELGKQWLEKHESRAYGLLAVFQEELAALAQERYGYSRRLDCYQAAYLSEEPPKGEHRLRIVQAKEQDADIILAHYDMLDREELLEGLRRGNLFLGYDGAGLVGFVGQHLEGCMGILEVLPQHRRKGYGRELEQFMITAMLEQGLIPYCQVECDNEKSLRLQESLGLTVSKEKVYVLY